MSIEIDGQLNEKERALLAGAVLSQSKKDIVVLEIGTWLGGGSTVTFLKSLQQIGTGHLWGIEADRSIYERMLANIRAAAPEASARFTPLFGFSQEVIPVWLKEKGDQLRIDVAFLDGGNNPQEQVDEFELIAGRIPVGGVLFSHDAKLRKGRWLVPYLREFDNWKSELHDCSEEGLFQAVKTAESPSPASLKSARSTLARMRWQPAEVAARYVPKPITKFIFKLMPSGLVRSIADGR